MSRYLIQLFSCLMPYAKVILWYCRQNDFLRTDINYPQSNSQYLWSMCRGILLRRIWLCRVRHIRSYSPCLYISVQLSKFVLLWCLIIVCICAIKIYSALHFCFLFLVKEILLLYINAFYRDWITVYIWHVHVCDLIISGCLCFNSDVACKLNNIYLKLCVASIWTIIFNSSVISSHNLLIRVYY